MSSITSANKYKKFEDEDTDAEGQKSEAGSNDDAIPEDTAVSVQFQKLQDDVTVRPDNHPATETDDDVFPVLVIPAENSAHVNVGFVHLGESATATNGDISQNNIDTPETVAKFEELKSSDISAITKVKKTSRRPPMTQPPPDYLGCSIFVTVLCCPILGAFAIHQSMQCRRAASRGHRARAIWASQTAWKVARVAFLVGILVQIVVVFALVEAFA